ncbi:MAG: hypothetical protein R3247_03410 [Rhodothermales bacterium]|nr:hypothetical protein [Rhodothermales bacterium]
MNTSASRRHPVWLVWMAAVLLAGCGSSEEIGPVPVRSTQEHRVDGSLYTPTTQSLLRTHSWLEAVEAVSFRTGRRDRATVTFHAPGEHMLAVHNLPMRHLVPRLHYRPAAEPDAFDALNLMLAEFSRNSVSVPVGAPGDAMAHFQTTLSERTPWQLRGDYEFEPNPLYRPQRVSVINNCLRPGLWELNATDRSGEIYHAWFDMPEDAYYALVARTNGLPEAFVREALQWHERAVPLDLGRLRTVAEDLGAVPVARLDEEVGFSSQGSRRKLHRDFALVKGGSGYVPPRRLGDFLGRPVAMASFVEPGIYSSKIEERTEFDFTFLSAPQHAAVRLVRPKTSYRFDGAGGAASGGDAYVEFDLDLGGGERLIIGNLPLDLLVEREDFTLHGFGVGILSAGDFAERRQFLLTRGPHPSFAYLAREEGGRLLALNSHGRGIEQVFIRSHPNAPTPHWEVIITSYERIVDLVKYRIPMPERLVEPQREASRRYIPPIYFTYRDDNVS